MELEITLGFLALFLSPRQLHVLIELGQGLACPDMEDVSNVAPKRCSEKPMGSCDFNRIEKELLNQINPINGLRPSVQKASKEILMSYFIFYIRTPKPQSKINSKSKRLGVRRIQMASIILDIFLKKAIFLMSEIFSLNSLSSDTRSSHSTL